MNKYKDLLGKKYITNQGYWVKIIAIINKNNVTIQFEDGLIVYNIYFSNLTQGKIRKPIDYLYQRFITNEGEEVQVIKVNSKKSVDIQFDIGFIMTVRIDNLLRGKVKNPYYKSLYNVGYHGVGRYKTTINKKKTTAFISWESMLARCYSKTFLVKNPTYIGVRVCEAWHCFQNFAEWFESKYNPEKMKGWHLDKDILSGKDKIYSPETCCLINQHINNMYLSRRKKLIDKPIGVRFVNGKYIARMSKKNEKSWTGYFDTEEEAISEFNIQKELYTLEVVKKYEDLLDPVVYEKLIKKQII